MPFWKNNYHLVWGTKDRMPIIQEEFEERLYGYIISKLNELGVIVFAINGTTDHIHAVVAIPPKYCVSEIIKLIKGSSSHYVNTTIKPGNEFQWQRGYGCMTVGEKHRPIAEAYVQNQKIHHEENSINSWLEFLPDETKRVKRVVGKERGVKEPSIAYRTDEEFLF